MIKYFIYNTDMDIIFLQAVETWCLDEIPGYTSVYNIGIEKCGTAIIFRDNLSATDLKSYQIVVGWHVAIINITYKHLRTVEATTTSSVPNSYIDFDTPHSIASFAETSTVSSPPSIIRMSSGRVEPWKP